MMLETVGFDSDQTLWIGEVDPHVVDTGESPFAHAPLPTTNIEQFPAHGGVQHLLETHWKGRQPSR